MMFCYFLLSFMYLTVILSGQRNVFHCYCSPYYRIFYHTFFTVFLGKTFNVRIRWNPSPASQKGHVTRLGAPPGSGPFNISSRCKISQSRRKRKYEREICILATKNIILYCYKMFCDSRLLFECLYTLVCKMEQIKLHKFRF